MSYSEVVGTLYELHKAGAVTAGFATERDRLLAQLLAAAETEPVTMRPENAEDTREVVVFGPDTQAAPTGPTRTEPGETPSLLVPLERPTEPGSESGSD